MLGFNRYPLAFLQNVFFPLNIHRQHPFNRLINFGSFSVQVGLGSADNRQSETFFGMVSGWFKFNNDFVRVIGRIKDNFFPGVFFFQFLNQAFGIHLVSIANRFLVLVTGGADQPRPSLSLRVILVRYGFSNYLHCLSGRYIFTRLFLPKLREKTEREAPLNNFFKTAGRLSDQFLLAPAGNLAGNQIPASSRWRWKNPKNWLNSAFVNDYFGSDNVLADGKLHKLV